MYSHKFNNKNVVHIIVYNSYKLIYTDSSFSISSQKLECLFENIIRFNMEIIFAHNDSFKTFSVLETSEHFLRDDFPIIEKLPFFINS